MTRYLTLAEVLSLHVEVLASSGGAAGIRDLGRVQAALGQPMATFDDAELHPTVEAKAAALGFSLIQGHSFVDGNKRIGHAAMEVSGRTDAPVRLGSSGSARTITWWVGLSHSWSGRRQW